MTINELIKKLQTLDGNLPVEVGVMGHTRFAVKLDVCQDSITITSDNI